MQVDETHAQYLFVQYEDGWSAVGYQLNCGRYGYICVGACAWAQAAGQGVCSRLSGIFLSSSGPTKRRFGVFCLLALSSALMYVEADIGCCQILPL